MRNFSRYQNRLWRPILMSMVLSYFMTACNNDSLAPDKVETTSTIVNEYDAGLEEVAKALAKSLADEQMRSFIKKEASKRVDGDYDILYSTVENAVIGGSQFAQNLKAAYSTGGAARIASMEEISKQLPLLNISVPVNIKKWDAIRFTPLVVVLSDDENKPLKAFDKDGNIHWLDPKKAPDVPVVVVGRSERYLLTSTGQAEMKKGLLPIDNGGVKVMSGEEQLPDDGSGGGGNDVPGNENSNPAPTGNDCSDMSKLNITLTGWYSGNISAIESWARGTPEIRMRAFAVTQAGTKVNVYGDPDRGNLWEPNSRNDVNQRWWNLSDYLFYWNVSSYGEEATFILHEEDGGSPKDISIPISYKQGGLTASTTISFRVDDGDDYVGYFPRRLPFCSGSTIGNETLKFKVNRN